MPSLLSQAHSEVLRIGLVGFMSMSSQHNPQPDLQDRYNVLQSTHSEQ